MSDSREPVQAGLVSYRHHEGSKRRLGVRVFPCFDDIVASVPTVEHFLPVAQLEEAAGALSGSPEEHLGEPAQALRSVA